MPKAKSADGGNDSISFFNIHIIKNLIENSM